MHIEYFKEFALLGKLLNYGVAAEQLYIAQPVLSRHIQALEKYLGAKLLNRSTQGVQLTPEGRALLGRLPEFLEGYDRLVHSVRVNGGDVPLSIRIGIPDYAINDYLKNAPQYIEKGQTLEIEFLTGRPDELISAVLGDGADAIIIPNIPFPGAKQLRFYNLFDERMGILCGRGDELAGKNEIEISDLRGRDILYVDSRYFDAMWAIIDGICRDSGFSLKKARLFKQVEAVVIEINRKGGLSIMGEHMRNISADQVVYIPFKNPEYSRKISLCCKKGNRSRAIEIMLKALNTAIGDTLPR